MIIIEAGATTTKVCQILDKQVSEISNYAGINPNYISQSDIHDTLGRALAHLQSDDTVHYYGAGCAQTRTQKIIRRILRSIQNFSTLTVVSDLLATARALAGNNAGQINILGTGSASCLYNGQEIETIYLNTGYILGDDGSGYDLGRRLLQAYFHGELDTESVLAIETYSGMDRSELIKTIYASTSPKSSIADFAHCASQLRKSPKVKDIIEQCFDNFIQYQIQLNPSFHSCPQYFSGSIAFHFEQELANSLEANDLSITSLCKSPMQNLIKYHLTSSQ